MVKFIKVMTFQQHMQKLYRGIWADHLENNNKLPVGGSIFSDELTTNLILNFDELQEDLQNYKTPNKIYEAYLADGHKIDSWLKNFETDFDPLIYTTLYHVNKKVQSILQTKNIEQLERNKKFSNDEVKLTDLIGLAMCAEHAALGQYLLQTTLPTECKTSYMSGVCARQDLNLEDHSFIILNKNNKTHIVDLGATYPQIFETTIPATLELFKEKNNLLIEGRDITTQNKKYFGVGHPFIDQDLNIIPYK